jgi:hypothetical protein
LEEAMKKYVFLWVVVLLGLSRVSHASKLDVSYRSPEMAKLDIQTIQQRAASVDTDAQFELGIRQI